MLRPGLVSITFRQLSPAEVIDLVTEAELRSIEWGADVHVPAGDLAAARDVGRQTRDAGLAVAAYGSYYRVGVHPPSEITAVLDSARELGAPIVRVWVGDRDPDHAADPDFAQRVYDDARRVADAAAERGLVIATEWHGNTFTDHAAAAAELFEKADHPNLQTYWQPHRKTPIDDCLVDLKTALPRLVGLHVFHWHVETVERLPLEDGEALWSQVLPRVASRGHLDALLEFVRGNDPEQFKRDAAALKRWVETANGPDAARA